MEAKGGAAVIRQRNEFEVITGGWQDHEPDFADSVDVLLARAREGDEVAWKEIVRRYGGVVFATVRSFRLQGADVFDAVQMTWLRLAENSHRVQFPERLAGWLATTARRECLRILRQQATRTPAPAETVVENVVDPAHGPEQRVIDRDTARMRRRLIANMSPLQRRTLLRALSADNPLPYTDVVRAMGIRPDDIGTTHERRMQQLRHRLTDATGEVSKDESAESVRTGSHLLDDFLDQAEQRLQEKLTSKAAGSVTLARTLVPLNEPSRAHIETKDLFHTLHEGTGDPRLDNLLHQAENELRKRDSD